MHSCIMTFMDKDTHLAFGMDTPTILSKLFPNLYNTTIRRSTVELDIKEKPNVYILLFIV
jgi:hypothetical protein